MNPAIEKLRQQRLDRVKNEAQSQATREVVAELKKLDQTTVQAFTALIGLIQNSTTRTEVVNQLKELETPDTAKAVRQAMASINDMHSTLKKKDVDLTPLITELKSVVDEVKKIQIDIPTPKVTVKAPDVNIQAPQAPDVHVDAPDLSKLEERINSLVSSIEEGLEVQHTNVLIHEKFDEWRIVLDDYDEDDPQPAGVRYYLKGKKVAELEYKTKNGMITGVKKVG